MDLSEARFKVRHRDPATGIVSTTILHNKSAFEVVKYLARGRFEAEALTLGVEDERSGYVRSAEQFLEDNPELAVVAAWSAGGQAARDYRQKRIEQLWPNLWSALVALEQTYAS